MKPAAGAALAALVLASNAAAHDLWIEPSTFRPAAGQTVALRLWVGSPFAGEPFPRTPEYIERFYARGADGDHDVPGRDGQDPAGTLRVAGGGPLVVAYRTHPYFLETDAEAFAHYLEEEGLETVARERERRGQAGEGATERFVRCAKSILGEAPPAILAAPLGCPLELVAESDLGALPGSAVFRLLWRGAPLQGVRVAAHRPEDPASPVVARTDAQGRVQVALPQAGVWLVKAVHTEPADAGQDVQWLSWWASLTFLGGRSAPPAPAAAGH